MVVGGQECPPSVNSCSGEAGSLCVLGVLGESLFVDAGKKETAKVFQERVYSETEWKVEGCDEQEDLKNHIVVSGVRSSIANPQRVTSV